MPKKHIAGVGDIEWTESEVKAWEQAEAESAAGATKRNALAEIQRLEGQVTQRRLREAYKDSTWLDAQEALIATERAKLKE